MQRSGSAVQNGTTVTQFGVKAPIFLESVGGGGLTTGRRVGSIHDDVTQRARHRQSATTRPVHVLASLLDRGLNGEVAADFRSPSF